MSTAPARMVPRGVCTTRSGPATATPWAGVRTWTSTPAASAAPAMARHVAAGMEHAGLLDHDAARVMVGAHLGAHLRAPEHTTRQALGAELLELGLEAGQVPFDHARRASPDRR